MSNTVNVELRPHVGRNYNAKLRTIVSVEHDQFIVMASVNGGPMTQVGYIGKSDGAPLNGIDTLRAMPKALQEQVKAAVEDARGGKPVTMFVPAEPDPILLGDDEEDDEDEEDEDQERVKHKRKNR